MWSQLGQQSKRHRRHVLWDWALKALHTRAASEPQWLRHTSTQQASELVSETVHYVHCSVTHWIQPPVEHKLWFPTTLQHHKQHSKNTPAQNGLDQVFKVCSHFSLNEQVKASCERGLSRSHPRDTDCSRVWQPTARSKLQPALHDTSCNQKVWPGLKTRNHPVTPSAVGLTQSGRCPDYLTHNLFMPQYISRFHPKCSTGAGAHFPFLPMLLSAEIRSTRAFIHDSLANHKHQFSL